MISPAIIWAAQQIACGCSLNLSNGLAVFRNDGTCDARVVVYFRTWLNLLQTEAGAFVMSIDISPARYVMGIRFGIPHILIVIVLTVGIAVLSRAQLRERPALPATVAARMVRDVILPQTEMAVDATVLQVDRTSLA